MLGQVRKLMLHAVLMALPLVAGCAKSETPKPAAPVAVEKTQAQEEQAPAMPGEGLVDLPPSASGKTYEVGLTLSPPAGDTQELVVRLASKDGFKLNADYPHHFRPKSSSEQVKFEKDKYELFAMSTEKKPCSKDPKDTCELHAKIPFTSTPGPDVRAAGVLAFSVCNPEQCLIEKVPLAVNVPAR